MRWCHSCTRSSARSDTCARPSISRVRDHAVPRARDGRAQPADRRGAVRLVRAAHRRARTTRSLPMSDASPLERPTQPQGPRLHRGGDRAPARIRRRPQAPRDRQRRTLRHRAGGYAARNLSRDGHPADQQSVVVRLHLRQAAVAALLRGARQARLSRRTAAATARSASRARSTTIRRPRRGAACPNRRCWSRASPANASSTSSASGPKRSAREFFPLEAPGWTHKDPDWFEQVEPRLGRTLRTAPHRTAGAGNARAHRAARGSHRPPLRRSRSSSR